MAAVKMLSYSCTRSYIRSIFASTGDNDNKPGQLLSASKFSILIRDQGWRKIGDAQNQRLLKFSVKFVK